mmetsp:Transcript_8912/g.32846  ORF Transcript_8912/g.32846 Transcript_8912/m.32846 type:complete len:127 (+) Transcript_8912:398-778(+)
MVALGTAESAATFAQKAPVPEKFIFADPVNATTDALQLYKGFDQGEQTINMYKKLGFRGSIKKLQSLREAAKGYDTSVSSPPVLEQVTYQGGLYVFKGYNEVLYEYKDPSPGVHAPLEEVLAACCA